MLDNLASCEEVIGFARRLKPETPLLLDYTVRAYRRVLELDESRLDIAVEMAGVIRRSGSSRRALRIYERVLAMRQD